MKIEFLSHKIFCFFDLFNRLNEYSTLLKSLKTRRDSLYSRLIELLEAKVKADDQKNWRLIQNDKLSSLKISLVRNKEQVTQGSSEFFCCFSTT